MKKDAIILFHSSNHAMWTKDILTEKSIMNKLIPVPRELSSDCGYCVKINSDDIVQVENLIKENNIEYDKIVEI
ncbi:MAG: DUF3343 domain-containing protein [Candidatus Delongbacteria bacterium]|nr:DUF3343 domain-containing protein [Candidatus Delongbacteria bacterium]